MLGTKPILLAGLLTTAASAAAAETCRDLVDRLAEQHALHAAPDTSKLPGAVTPEDLARSGDTEAVVEPPPTGDPMPTAPPLEGGASAGGASAGGPAAGEPAHQQAQVDAL